MDLKYVLMLLEVFVLLCQYYYKLFDLSRVVIKFEVFIAFDLIHDLKDDDLGSSKVMTKCFFLFVY